jgi:hypothetical protein
VVQPSYFLFWRIKFRFWLALIRGRRVSHALLNSRFYGGGRWCCLYGLINRLCVSRHNIVFGFVWFSQVLDLGNLYLGGSMWHECLDFASFLASLSTN